MDFNSLKRFQRDAATDLKILRGLLPALSLDERVAIQMRFWEDMTIEEIASALDLSWQATDRLIENSIQKLRQGFEKAYRDRALSVAS